MDIAEIRKKAKALSSADNASSAPAVPHAAPAAPPLAPLGESAPQGAPPAAVAQPSAGDTRSDALDRLFAVSDELALVSDEGYTDILANQADSQALVRRQYLAFHLGAEEYALDITLINEIIKVREFTDIPRVPGFILGIISLRGVVVPVFDLRRRLNLGTAEILPTSRIVVAQQDDITVGLLVDGINQVVKLADHELEPPPGVLSGLDRDMVAGLGRYQGRMIILLNVRNVLDAALQ